MYKIIALILLFAVPAFGGVTLDYRDIDPGPVTFSIDDWIDFWYLKRNKFSTNEVYKIIYGYDNYDLKEISLIPDNITIEENVSKNFSSIKYHIDVKTGMKQFNLKKIYRDDDTYYQQYVSVHYDIKIIGGSTNIDKIKDAIKNREEISFDVDFVSFIITPSCCDFSLKELNEGILKVKIYVK